MTLRLSIDESGEVTDAVIANADPPGVFDESAIAAYKRAKFYPALKGDAAVRSWILVKVNYESRP